MMVSSRRRIMFANPPRARSIEELGGASIPERKFFGVDGVHHDGPEPGQAPKHGASRPARAERSRREAPVRRASWALPPRASSVPAGRHLVIAQLADWGLDEQSDVAQLLVSELLANALRHGWGEPILTLSSHGNTLRCEIKDDNPTPPPAPQICDADHTAEAGRGLQLVQLLSRSWGCNGCSAGKIVWFELPVQPMSASGA
ncbi:ATP-binding protein [Streptomyces sp. KR80]|uniref:ATP-binding protein n=1 Tax=Streptomyces sp. KR80 TaxID=3457426 RepID=UPI003FD1C1D6